MPVMFPDFLVHTGDVEYYDKPAPYALTEELMRFKWAPIVPIKVIIIPT